LNMLLRNDARRTQRDDLLDIALSLPFQTEVNTGFGILAKVYLDSLTHINGGTRVTAADVKNNPDGVHESKEAALVICDDNFLGVKNPRTEVERGFRFWDVVSPVCYRYSSPVLVLFDCPSCFNFSFWSSLFFSALFSFAS
jgi:hypothetical protein